MAKPIPPASTLDWSDLVVMALPRQSFDKLALLSQTSGQTIAQIFTQAVDSYVTKLEKREIDDR